MNSCDSLCGPRVCRNAKEMNPHQRRSQQNRFFRHFYFESAKNLNKKTISKSKSGSRFEMKEQNQHPLPLRPVSSERTGRTIESGRSPVCLLFARNDMPILIGAFDGQSIQPTRLNQQLLNTPMCVIQSPAGQWFYPRNCI